MKAVRKYMTLVWSKKNKVCAKWNSLGFLPLTLFSMKKLMRNIVPNSDADLISESLTPTWNAPCEGWHFTFTLQIQAGQLWWHSQWSQWPIKCLRSMSCTRLESRLLHTSDPISGWWAWEAAQVGASIWVPATTVEEPETVPGSCTHPDLALTVVGAWGVNSWKKISLFIHQRSILLQNTFSLHYKKIY